MLTYAIVLVQNYLAALKEEEGQGMAEYALILALISVAAIAVLMLIGPEVTAVFQTVLDAFTGV